VAVADASTWRLKDALQPGIAAVRRYWAPFLLIQAAVAALVVLYYQIPDVQAFADRIGAFKKASGILFAAIGGFVAGGIVPEIAKAVTGRIKAYDRIWIKNMLFAGLIYAVVAIEVDLFYQLQAFMFGHGIEVGTVLTKLAVDMFLFSPILCMPTGIVMVDWRRNGYRPIPTVRGIHRIWYRERVIPAMIPGWAFWIPFLCAVYALPLTLQIPICLLGEAAWSLVFIFIANEEGNEASTEG